MSMNTVPIRSIGDPKPLQPASWLNRAWTYAPAATHGDSTAFRARMAEYKRRGDGEEAMTTDVIAQQTKEVR